MQQRANIIAQRLLNIYRQAHVIAGGWVAVNKMLLAESDDETVLAILETLPTGKNLVKHINSLRNGTTPIDSINQELLPYGGLMNNQNVKMALSGADMDLLNQALHNFEPTSDNLNKIKELQIVKRYGKTWIEDIKSGLLGQPELLSKWDMVIRTEKAYHVWELASKLSEEQLTDKTKARIQADIQEFETYLPMFGETGRNLLKKLRSSLSSM